MSIAAVDVHYWDSQACAACVEFGAWADAVPVSEHRVAITSVEPYVPGQFYRRELPCLLAVLKQLSSPLVAVVIDGYVWLEGDSRPGLGAHLYESMGRQTPVIGVAKTHYAGASPLSIYRGESSNPLYITVVGVSMDSAASWIQGMHGEHRIPTLLKRVDRLSRTRT